MKKAKEVPSPVVVGTYETEIEYICPVRGKVKQQVLVKRYESAESPAVVEEVLPKKSLTEELDRQYSGLLVSDDSLDEPYEEEV